TDHLQARLHLVLRQLDAGRRRGPRDGQGRQDETVHDAAREHEDPRRGRDAAAGSGSWRTAGRASRAEKLARSRGGNGRGTVPSQVLSGRLRLPYRTAPATPSVLLTTSSSLL